jgi:CheY-like chemotaxis protein
VQSLLIVDDHPSFRTMARETLSRRFTVVGEAADGAEALDLAARLHPDVVLLDVHLPDIDGFDVAEALTRQDEPPVVVLTSSRHRSDLPPLARTCHAHGFIDKEELTAEALAELVRARL